MRRQTQSSFPLHLSLSPTSSLRLEILELAFLVAVPQPHQQTQNTSTFSSHGHCVVHCSFATNQASVAMSYSYERQRRSTYGAATRRTTWGYWIPLAVTVTFATAGLVAWIWKERSDEEAEDLAPGPPPPDYGNGPPPPSGYFPPPQGYSDAPPPGFQGPPAQPPYDSGPQNQPPYAPGPNVSQTEDESIVARMSGALRRTPSPQQIFDGARRNVVAGVTAAGAAVGGALSSITEEDKTGYEDHSRWSEEAGSQNGGPPGRQGPELRDLESSSSATVRQATHSGAKVGGRRKTVAIVVSAETDYEHSEDAGYHQEHAVSPVRRLGKSVN